MLGKLTYTVTLEVKTAGLYQMEEGDEDECEICEADVEGKKCWIAFIGHADTLICVKCWNKYYKKEGA